MPRYYDIFFKLDKETDMYVVSHCVDITEDQKILESDGKKVLSNDKPLNIVDGENPGDNN